MNKSKANYAQLNGVNLYYEIHGQGSPLILLHGGLGTIDAMFTKLLPIFAAHHQVIPVELQAHGHTADIDRPLSFESMADDIAALIRHVGLGQVDILGYSLGGGAALQLIIRHPGLVRKLVLLSTTFQRNGWYPEVLAGMAAMSGESAQAMVGSPVHQAYLAAAPHPEDWSALIGKTGDLLRRDYDWSGDVRRIKSPVLLTFGDADSIKPVHAVEFFALLGGGQKDGSWDGSGMVASRLAILPGTTHFTILDQPELPGIVTSFIDAPEHPGA